MGGKTKVLFKGAVWEVYEVWADRWAKDGGCIHIGLAERAKHQSARRQRDAVFSDDFFLIFTCDFYCAPLLTGREGASAGAGPLRRTTRQLRAARAAPTRLPAAYADTLPVHLLFSHDDPGVAPGRACLCRDHQIRYHSRFLRVILAQGPC